MQKSGFKGEKVGDGDRDTQSVTKASTATLQRETGAERKEKDASGGSNRKSPDESQPLTDLHFGFPFFRKNT